MTAVESARTFPAAGTNFPKRQPHSEITTGRDEPAATPWCPSEIMNAPAPYIAIVDDDASVRKALARLLGASALNPQTYASGQQFLKSLEHAVPRCLIVDLQMPEMTGLELHSELLRAGIEIPTILSRTSAQNLYFSFGILIVLVQLLRLHQLVI